MSEQIWKPIPGFEGFYEVSNDGRVRSLISGNEKVAGIKGDRKNGGGLYLGVALHRNGTRRDVKVHHLVLQAFVGPRPFDGAVARHLNGDPFDNRAANLAWGTQSENMADRIAHGRDPHRSQTHCVHGHEFTADNTKWVNGWRRCVECMRRRERDRLERRNRQRREATAARRREAAALSGNGPLGEVTF